MTRQEISAALRDIIKDLGRKASITMHIDSSEGDGAVYIGLYPFGIGTGEAYLSATGRDFADVLEKMRAAWAKYEVEHRKQITNKMALAIIRLTEACGECTDAALRQEFDASQIAKFGNDACTLADQMAAKGPFSITCLQGANAAAA